MPPKKDLEFNYLCKKAVVLFLILGARTRNGVTAITTDNVLKLKWCYCQIKILKIQLQIAL